MGALMGVYSGLKAAHYPFALAVACDMPFLNLPLLRYMLTRAVDYDVVVPHIGTFFEPLHAVYGKTCLPAMQDSLAQRRRQIVAFFPRVRVYHVKAAEIESFDPGHLSFLNINTPEDWAKARSLLSS